MKVESRVLPPEVRIEVGCAKCPNKRELRASDDQAVAGAMGACAFAGVHLANSGGPAKMPRVTVAQTVRTQVLVDGDEHSVLTSPTGEVSVGECAPRCSPEGTQDVIETIRDVMENLGAKPELV